MVNYQSEIELGKVYQHPYLKKVKGKAVAIYFYSQGCNRIAILPESSTSNDWLVFDEPDLLGKKPDQKFKGGVQPKDDIRFKNGNK